MKKVAINGMGRIGRLCFRALLANDEMEIVAVNDTASMDMIAYLVRHDTEHGPLDPMWKVNAGDDVLSVNGHDIPAFYEADASKLPWSKLNIDLVLECTGSYTSKAAAQAHVDAGSGACPHICRRRKRCADGGLRYQREHYLRRRPHHIGCFLFHCGSITTCQGTQ